MYAVGDRVWLRMGDAPEYPAVITGVADYVERHRDGTPCQDYYADVYVLHEVVHDGLVSECCLRPRTEEETLP